MKFSMSLILLLFSAVASASSYEIAREEGTASAALSSDKQSYIISCERSGGGYLVHEHTVSGDNWFGYTYPDSKWMSGIEFGERDSVNFGIGTGGGPAGGDYLLYSSIQIDGPKHLRITRTINGQKVVETVENQGQLIHLDAEKYSVSCHIFEKEESVKSHLFFMPNFCRTDDDCVYSGYGKRCQAVSDDPNKPGVCR